MKTPVDGKLPRPIPGVIKTTQMCDNLMHQRCNHYNKYYKPAYNGNLSPALKEATALVIQKPDMPTLLTRNEKLEPLSDKFLNVSKYHAEVHNAEIVYPEKKDEIHALAKDTNTNVKFVGRMARAQITILSDIKENQAGQVILKV